MFELKIFKSEQFGQIRTQVDRETQEVVFCGKDVAEALGYTNPRKALIDHCKGGNELVTPSFGGPQKMKFIKEADIYRLVMRSKLPEAESFQDWVCEVVLPQIRRTGGYIPIGNADGSITEDELLSRALMIAQKTITEKDALLRAQQHDVDFAKAVTASPDCIEIQELAKFLTQNGYEIGQDRLINWLRKHNFIFKKGFSPIQRYVESNLFQLQEELVHTTHGEIIRVHTMVTAKGQRYFLARFLSQQAA